MKKKKFNKKLSLNKETISNLNEIKGGGGEKYSNMESGCQTCSPVCGSVGCNTYNECTNGPKCAVQITDGGVSACQACS